MAKHKKLAERILSGVSGKNIRFYDLCSLLRNLGFKERVKGSHFIYTREDVHEIINLQPAPDNKSKPYQVKQVRQIIVRYKLYNKD